MLGDVGELVHLGAAGAALVHRQHLVAATINGGEVPQTDQRKGHEQDEKGRLEQVPHELAKI